MTDDRAKYEAREDARETRRRVTMSDRRAVLDAAIVAVAKRMNLTVLDESPTLNDPYEDSYYARIGAPARFVRVMFPVADIAERDLDGMITLVESRLAEAQRDLEIA